jgi:hypothetical protein
MKKRGWIVLFLAFPLWMQGQSAREEIGKNPALAAGKYYAYQAPEEKLTPAPAGYEPFYISMFARHGSRYLTKEKKYAAPLSLLLEADEEGVLTPDGKCVLKVVASLAQEAEGRYGELTPKGAQQHRELIDRMFHRYPEVFSDGTHVDARSTYKTRAFLSMAAGCGACIQMRTVTEHLRVTVEHPVYQLPMLLRSFRSQLSITPLCLLGQRSHHLQHTLSIRSQYSLLVCFKKE